MTTLTDKSVQTTLTVNVVVSDFNLNKLSQEYRDKLGISDKTNVHVIASYLIQEIIEGVTELYGNPCVQTRLLL